MLLQSPIEEAIAMSLRILEGCTPRIQEGSQRGESRTFASGEYLAALFAGESLDKDQRRLISKKLSRLTGMPEDFILENRLRISSSMFRKKLLIEEGLICGRYDGRITGRDGDYSSLYPSFDPSYMAALGPLAATMNAYVREELAFENDLP